MIERRHGPGSLPNRGPLLSAQAAADRLNRQAPELHLSPRWVKAHVRPVVRLSPRKYAWYEHDLDSWVEAQRSDRLA